jgi:structural maintenance of chromosome 2
MKPQEILGMVEEAAGTRMFEDRKDKAKKTMAKKDKRLQELSNILTEEIAPKLNKLREEKRAFLEYQKAESELERIERVLKAWDWTDYQTRLQSATENIEEKKQAKKQLEADKKQLKQEIDIAEKGLHRAHKKREEEMKKGGKISQLEEEVASLDKEVVKVRTQVEIKEGTVRDEEAGIRDRENEVQEVSHTFIPIIHQCSLSLCISSMKPPSRKRKLTSTTSQLNSNLSKLPTKPPQTS